MSEFHFDEKFWLAMAFLAFLALLLKFAKSAIIKSLEAKSQQIAKEILDAKEMKEKAAQLLAKAEKFAQESELYAQKVIKDAEIEALKYANETKKTIEEEVAKKTAAALERIKMEEQLAVSQIKEKIINGALSEFTEKFAKDQNNEQHKILNDKAIKDLEKLLS